MDRIHPKADPKRPHLLYINQKGSKTSVYLHCSSKGYKSNEKEKLIWMQEPSKILYKKEMCYNYTNTQHRPSECKRKRTCQIKENVKQQFLTKPET